MTIYFNHPLLIRWSQYPLSPARIVAISASPAAGRVLRSLFQTAIPGFFRAESMGPRLLSFSLEQIQRPKSFTVAPAAAQAHRRPPRTRRVRMWLTRAITWLHMAQPTKRPSKSSTPYTLLEFKGPVVDIIILLSWQAANDKGTTINILNE